MPPSRNPKKLTFSLIQGGSAGGQGGGCTMRGPQGGFGGMDYSPPSPYGGNPMMQGQYGGGGMGGGMGGGGMGYNQGCPTSPCGGDPYGRGSMGMDPYAMGGGMPGSMGMASMGGDQRGSVAASAQYAAEAMRNANCPTSGCPRGNGHGNGNGSMAVSGSFAGSGAVQFQVPCLECGGLPNPACRPPNGNGNGNGGIMMTPCQECGGIPNPPCGGGENGGGAGGGVSLTPCQECGGLPSPPCGAGTCGGATPCAECAGNPDAPCLNMGPCDYCPEPPPVDDSANQEVFVLKIGKKRLGTDKKPRMELELVTPKAPVVKPIPKLETRDTQYDPKDVNGKKNGKKKKK